MTKYEYYETMIVSECNDPVDTKHNLNVILDEAFYDPEITEREWATLHDYACELYGHDLG